MKNKQEFVEQIENEIEKINKAIDRKIAAGKLYVQEAKKHEQLVELLATYA